MRRVLTVFAIILAFALAAQAIDNPYNGYFVIGDPALFVEECRVLVVHGPVRGLERDGAAHVAKPPLGAAKTA